MSNFTVAIENVSVNSPSLSKFRIASEGVVDSRTEGQPEGQPAARSLGRNAGLGARYEGPGRGSSNHNGSTSTR